MTEKGSAVAIWATAPIVSILSKDERVRCQEEEGRSSDDFRRTEATGEEEVKVCHCPSRRAPWRER